MKILLTLMLILSFSIASAQQQNDVSYKTKYLIGFFPNKNPQIIYGLSIGPFSTPKQKHIYNGLTLELIGLGWAGLLGGFGKGVEDSIKYQSSQANGIAISTTGGIMNSNGICAGGIVLFAYQMNGISFCLGYSEIKYGNGIIASGFNNCENVKGIQIGAFNGAENLTGIQIAMTNKTKKLKGIQIGVWNVNEKRKLPIINWNF